MASPKHPLYIPSKGRADCRYTAKALDEMKVPYLLVVEEQEYTEYCRVAGKDKVLVLDKSYQDDYDTFDNLGNTKSKGPGPARNFIWDHSISNGHTWHWVMDDNIRAFYRLNRNRIERVYDGAFWLAMETFCERYTNVAMAGPNYELFVLRRAKSPPFILNTRIYSCSLIRNDVSFRWRGRYNEDTDLSLRMLKAGWCTVQFNAFLQDKIATQQVKGGNTSEFYEKDGTLPKSQMQVAMHPDVSRLVWKFGRWHHQVNYKPFRVNKLIRKKGISRAEKNNEFGMKRRKIK